MVSHLRTNLGDSLCVPRMAPGEDRKGPGAFLIREEARRVQERTHLQEAGLPAKQAVGTTHITENIRETTATTSITRTGMRARLKYGGPDN